MNPEPTLAATKPMGDAGYMCTGGGMALATGIACSAICPRRADRDSRPPFLAHVVALLLTWAVIGPAFEMGCHCVQCIDINATKN